MLRTRLWMGAVLVALVVGVLVVDQWLPPWFPFPKDWYSWEVD